MATKPNRHTPEPAPLHRRWLLRLCEAAELFGIDESSLRARLADGVIPLRQVHLGKSVRLNRLEGEAWLKAGCPAGGEWQWPFEGAP